MVSRVIALVLQYLGICRGYIEGRRCQKKASDSKRAKAVFKGSVHCDSPCRAESFNAAIVPELWHFRGLSGRPVAPYEDAMQVAVLAFVKVEARFVHGGPVVDDQHVADLPFMYEVEFGLDGFFQQVFQEVLRFLRLHADDPLGLGFVEPD